MEELNAQSPTPSVFEQSEQNPPIWNDYDDLAPPEVDDINQDDYEDIEEGDIITEVSRCSIRKILTSTDLVRIRSATLYLHISTRYFGKLLKALSKQYSVF